MRWNESLWKTTCRNYFVRCNTSLWQTTFHMSCVLTHSCERPRDTSPWKTASHDLWHIPVKDRKSWLVTHSRETPQVTACDISPWKTASHDLRHIPVKDRKSWLVTYPVKDRNSWLVTHPVKDRKSWLVTYSCERPRHDLWLLFPISSYFSTLMSLCRDQGGTETKGDGGEGGSLYLTGSCQPQGCQQFCCSINCVRMCVRVGGGTGMGGGEFSGQ